MSTINELLFIYLFWDRHSIASSQKRKIYLSLRFGDTIMNLKLMKKSSLNKNV